MIVELLQIRIYLNFIDPAEKEVRIKWKTAVITSTDLYHPHAQALPKCGHLATEQKIAYLGTLR
jgi:hypothetical protein